jgi:alpha-beta hydrolase superfamily lysophospholipase
MIELLNPSLGDAGRFAKELLAFRLAYARASQSRATEMAVARFCTPTGRRDYPDLQGLQKDAWRFARTRLEDLPSLDISRIGDVLQTAQRAHISAGHEKIATYHWPALSSPLKRKNGPAPRALLVHGWEGYALNFALQIRQLLDAGYEVFSFDHIAHGCSSGEFSGLPAFVQGLAAVNAHWGMQAKSWDAVFGHSLGGGAVLYSCAYGVLKAKRLALLAPFIDTPHLLQRWAQLHGLNKNAAVLMEREIERQSVIPGMRMSDMLPSTLASRIDANIFIAHDPQDIVVPIRTSREFANQHSQARLHPCPKAGHVGLLFDEKLLSDWLG